MPATAQDILDHAPLGAIVRFANGEPEPPARFRRKLSAWKDRNAIGRLVEKSSDAGPAGGHFVLHLGNYGTGETIILSVNRVFMASSELSFSVERVPQPGEALVLSEFAGRSELKHVAPSEAQAIAWLERNRYSRCRIEIVAADATGVAT